MNKNWDLSPGLPDLLLTALMPDLILVMWPVKLGHGQTAVPGMETPKSISRSLGEEATVPNFSPWIQTYKCHC